MGAGGHKQPHAQKDGDAARAESRRPGDSVAGDAGLLALRRHSPAGKPVPIPGNPRIPEVLGPADGRQPIRGAEHCPWAGEIHEHPVDCRGAAERAAGAVHGPNLTVCILASDPVALENTGGLIREGQHTAGGIVRPNPAHGASTEPSGAVEEQDQAGRTHTRRWYQNA
jgi:hypothetical protein